MTISIFFIERYTSLQLALDGKHDEIKTGDSFYAIALLNYNTIVIEKVKAFF
jgi:hypothetical protein